MRQFLAMLICGLIATAAGAADEAVRKEEAQLGTQPKASELRADQLDSLFGSLQANTGLRDPARTESSIWKLWGESDSRTLDLLLGQGTRAMNAAEFDIAEMMFTRVIDGNANYAEAYNKRATLYYILQRYEDSLRDIEKVLDLEPRHFGALSGRGMIYQKLGKYQLAISAYRDALSVNPTMAGVQATLKQLEKLSPGI
jgi:tetratricopeptide (TPR) repeat protein